MFGVEITDHYVVYDHDKQCRDVGSLYPAIDIKLYGKKSKKVRMHDCWYSEFLFQSTAASVHYTQRGNYLHFRLTDYGVKDVRGVFCQVLHEGAPINNKEYYQTILYDANDSFSLYTPVNEEIMTESISLCITGVKYWNNDQIIESTSYPQKITAKQKKINQGIRSARDQHTALPIEKTTGKVTKSTRKLPFAEEYIEMAWIWYPELSELFTWVSSQCDLLEEEISALPQSIMGVDCSTPNENDKVIFIPIECTFNQKFYARLFLAQNHTVEGRIVSPLDMLQYQIPIRAENEPLLLCLYGTYWLDPLMLSPGDAIGDDKCKNTYSDAETNSPILRIIGEIKDRVSHRYSERTVQSSNVMRRFYRSIEALRTWIKERYTEVSSLSQEARPSLWTSEYRLYQYIKLLCSDAVYQYRSSWLDTQSLDIFIPQYSCAIEYQGQQHYDAIDYFGGEAKLLMQREMDADKRQKCQNNGVKLIEWSYKEKLTFSKVLSFLNENVFPEPTDSTFVERCLSLGLPFPVADLFLPVTYAQIKEAEKAKPFVQQTEIRKYALDGNYICAYNSITDAAKDVAISSQQISKVLNGRASTAGGFMWERVDTGTPVYSIAPAVQYSAENTSKSIYQVDSTGEIVAEFDSINSAERRTGINRKSIRDVLNGRQKTAGGYYWLRKHCE